MIEPALVPVRRKREPKSKVPNPKLCHALLDLSESKQLNTAICEWIVYSVDYNENCCGECVCGCKKCYYLYTLRNVHNNNYLAYIGSICVGYFVKTNKEIKEVKHVFDSDNNIFDPPGAKTFVSGMKYIDIYNACRWWLDGQVSKWRPGQSQDKNTKKRNKEFTKIITWYKVRKAYLKKRY